MENKNTISGTKTGKAFQTLGRLSRRPGASTMALQNGGERQTVPSGARTAPQNGLGRTRLARELFGGRYRGGQYLQLDKIAAEYGMDDDSVLKAFDEFQTLGAVTLTGEICVIVHAPSPQETEEGYAAAAA